MKLSKGLIIAVDFDGTIVEDGYPSIGQERLFAFETLKRLQADGHRLILWTYRHGKKLDEAVAYCQDNGITFYAVNQSFPEEVFKNEVSRKIHADLFIDDRNIGGILGWGAIYQMLTNDTPQLPKPKKKSWFKF
ncbi:BT0820 family HAD-type phosphatase [Olleya sp. Bg11-27]|uniref:BT0820 family HAD-type phosphatase n=1 Tax=Olleya sp. Bg11-27 TaxID=2058135 RepID=UPI000C309A0F|nr:hydrolase [Olleya sp. Bg11-27]AUC74171.1 hydrolase [Olleya sp. Bg11-27]